MLKKPKKTLTSLFTLEQQNLNYCYQNQLYEDLYQLLRTYNYEYKPIFNISEQLLDPVLLINSTIHQLKIINLLSKKKLYFNLLFYTQVELNHKELLNTRSKSTLLCSIIHHVSELLSIQEFNKMISSNSPSSQPYLNQKISKNWKIGLELAKITNLNQLKHTVYVNLNQLFKRIYFAKFIYLTLKNNNLCLIHSKFHPIIKNLFFENSLNPVYCFCFNQNFYVITYGYNRYDYTRCLLDSINWPHEIFR